MNLGGFRPSGWAARVLTLLAVLAGAGACDSSILPLRDGGADGKLDGGSIQINGSANNCPNVALTLSPPEADVGEHVVVGASASDPDLNSTLTYAWSAAAGSFDNDKSSQTYYTCTNPGPQIVTISVSDGQCTTIARVTVYCFGQGGGPSNGSGGSSSSGTGGKPGTGGGSGGKPSGGTATGGSGTGTGGSKPATGSGGMPGSGGTTGSGSGGSSMAMCSGDPTTDEGDSCNSCTTENCVPDTDSCSSALPGIDSDAKAKRCFNLYCCMRANHCAKLSDKGIMDRKCWCGDAPSSAMDSAFCQIGDSSTGKLVANGPCIRELLSAEGFDPDDPAVVKTIDSSYVRGHLIDANYPAGGAINLYVCRSSFCQKNETYTTDQCSL